MTYNDSKPASELAPRRIALVTTELRPGGAERNLVALAIGLHRENFLPHVYSLAPPPPAGADLLVTKLQAANVPVSFVGVRRSWQFFTAFARLREMLHQQSPELVQSFLFHANVVSAAACRHWDLPVVAGLRVAQREVLRRFVQRRLANRFAAFVCVSQGVAKIASEGGGVEKVHVIPNGLEAERFEDVTKCDLSAFGIKADQRVILYLGRMQRQKGVDVLIDAAKTFLPQLENTVLLLVGDGAERERLQRQIQGHLVSDRVVFAPWQPDPLALISAADLVVIPSRWEGMSNVLLEAAALAKPIVATEVEGVREMLSSLGQANLVCPDDPTALSKKIVEALDDEHSEEIAGTNRQFVWNQFPLEETISAYATLYRSLIDCGNRI